jgi:hypothetical protein
MTLSVYQATARLCMKTHLPAAKRLLMFPLPLAAEEGWGEGLHRRYRLTPFPA